MLIDVEGAVAGRPGFFRGFRPFYSSRSRRRGTNDEGCALGLERGETGALGRSTGCGPMSFNSAKFLFFFPLVLVAYALTFHRERWREVMHVLATVVDYSVGRLIVQESRPEIRRIILVASLCSNLGMLCVFKYYNFFVELAGPATTVLGLDVSILRHELLLPVGISF